MRHLSIIALLVALPGAVACGGKETSPPPAAATTSSAPATTPAAKSDKGPEIATGNTLTEFQKSRLLGHYSTEDGASGFILDRTATPWRGKLDGPNKTVTLTKSNTPRRGETEYASEDHSIWIRVIDESGSVEYFQGPKQNEGVRVRRDADAQQLK